MTGHPSHCPWPAIVAAVALAILPLVSCTHSRAPSAAAIDTARTIPLVPMSEPSIYDLDVALVDADGRAATLPDLRGRTVVATMIYTSCAAVCPRVIEDMKAIERVVPDRLRGAVTLALFSLDPARDTPEALRRFAADRQLRGPEWRLFTTPEDGVRTLAAALGVKYAREPSGELAHSALIVVIDPDGVVRHRQIGLSSGPGAVMHAIVAATPVP